VTFLPDVTLAHLKDVAAWPEFTSDRYIVHEALGRGGMGVVYGATDTALGREVAIKVGARLTSEARALASLEHPGIVPVHDYGELADGRPFYVMKRVDGRTLETHLASEPALAERLRIFERIAEAVAFAHARGVVHRDLTPANVMVGSFGEVMVMDFGAALVSEHAAGDAHVVIGTRGFMAPEQAAGGSGADARSDVYALGAVLSAMLPEGAPRPLISICARAMEPDPARRYQTVDAMAADVRRFREGAAVLAHRENLAERAGRFGRRYQIPILLVLAYIVMRALIASMAGV
jgi:serine/threonine protein kinase